MKKSTLLYRRLALVAIAFGLLVFISPHVHAQGFFTHTGHNNIGLEGALFGFLPDGYEVKVSYTTLSEEFCAGYLDLNLEGVETGWSNECYPIELGPTSTSRYFWLPDGDLLSIQTTWADTLLHIIKMQPGGDTLWHSTISLDYNWVINILDVEQNGAGEIFICASKFDDLQQQTNEFFLAKFDPGGNLLWQRNDLVFQSAVFVATTVAPMPDGGCVYSSLETNGVSQSHSLTRITSDGEVDWKQPLLYFYPNILTDDAGNIYALWAKNTPPDTDMRLTKRDPQGQILWENDLNETGITHYTVAMAKAVNGDILTINYRTIFSQSDFDLDFARFTPNGGLLWKKNFSFLQQQGGSFSIYAAGTPDNGFIVAGMLEDSLFVLKMGPNGEVYPGTLNGQLALDANVNCLNDTMEQPLAHWLVTLSGDVNLFAATDSTGHYQLGDVPAGDYQLSVVPLSGIWEPCPAVVPVGIPDTGSTEIQQDFSIQALVDCPFMTIDLSTPLLRRCFENTYTVYYCNNGSIAADSAFVEITLDPALDFNGANIPFTQNGDVLHFPLGTVAALECGSFQFTVTPDCDSTVIGQTLCVDAIVFPDTICNPPLNWSGATLVGSAACESDSIRFTLRNIGTAPSTPALDFIVVDDHVIMMQTPLPSLAPGGEYIAATPANGSNWRFMAEQEPNHPGNEPVSVGVEGCGGFIFPSFLLQFPNSDGNPFSALDCQEVIGSWDPNDKSATPGGVKDEHYIEPGTPLTYRIRFQNTGTDTAFTVVVRDTLSAWLDPATLRTGASSHPYTFELSGTGILTFTFHNIALPDSNVNEPASHGFVQFTTGQRADVPLGTVLENRAGIYFDFNPVVLTNTVWHTVDTGFLKIYVNTEEPEYLNPDLHIFPNPASETVFVTFPDENAAPGGHLRLFDVFGKKLREINVDEHVTEFRRGTLPAGIYWLEWENDKKMIRRGKIVLK